MRLVTAANKSPSNTHVGHIENRALYLSHFPVLVTDIIPAEYFSPLVEYSVKISRYEVDLLLLEKYSRSVDFETP